MHYQSSPYSIDDIKRGKFENRRKKHGLKPKEEKDRNWNDIT